MEVTRKSTDSDLDQKYLRVAVDINGEIHLKKINLGLDLEESLELISAEHNLPYGPEKYALVLCTEKCPTIEGTMYMTEENKHEVKNGTMLKFTSSAKARINSLIKNMDKLEVLERIADLAKDRVVLKELSNQQVIKKVEEITQEPIRKIKKYIYCFRILEQGLVMGYIDSISDEGVAKLLDFVSSEEKLLNGAALLSLRLLTLLSKKRKLRFPQTLLQDILPHIWDRDSPETQQAALGLLNSLFLHSNNEQELHSVYKFLSSETMIRYIRENILSGVLHKEMKHQLYVYQTIVLKKYNNRLRTLILEGEEIFQMLQTAATSHFYELDKFSVHLDEIFDGSERQKMKKKSRSLQSLTHDLFGNLRSSFSRRKRIRTTSSGSQFSSSDDEHGFCDFRVVQNNSDGGEYRKASSFTKYIPDLDTTPVPSSLFESPLSFQFCGKVDKKVFRNGFVKSKAKSTSNIAKAEITSKPDVMKSQTNHQGTPKTKKKKERRVKKTISKLALDNIAYMAQHDKNSYRKWFLNSKENCKAVLQLGNDVTNLLCEILEIGKRFKIDETSENFHPLFFNEFKSFLEELFIVTIQLYGRTSKDMKARVESDVPKVLGVVKEQLILALNTRPVTFKVLEANLQAFNYDVVSEKRKADLAEQMKLDLANKPAFLKVRELKQPEIVVYCRKRRLDFMESGELMFKLNLRGQKIKGKQEFISLTERHTTFVFEDWTEIKENKYEKKIEKRLPVSEITEVAVGRESMFYKEVAYTIDSERDMFFRAGAKQLKMGELDFPVSLHIRDGSYINFCSTSEVKMNYWKDGINHLLGQPMNSHSFTTELNDLLDLEVRLHFLEVEGIDLPDVPPAIPPEPPNYDFCIE